MNEKRMIEEATAVVSNYVDDIIFYLTEYGEDLGYKKIADIFAVAYIKMAKTLAEEIKEKTEEE